MSYALCNAQFSRRAGDAMRSASNDRITSAATIM